MKSYRKYSTLLSYAVLATGCIAGQDAGGRTTGDDSLGSSVVGGGSTSDSAAAAAPEIVAGGSRAHAPSQSGQPKGSPEVLRLQRDGDAPIRGLYVNRFAAQSPAKLARLIAIADSTEINAFVIDFKDEFGVNYVSSDSMVRRNAGTMTKATNLRAWVDSMRAHGILPIARIVVFKDSVAARLNPQHTIRRPDGSAWRDREGLTWVSPYSRAIWEYNFRVGDDAIRMGFGEIQFDYIRFPEPYRSLPQQVFPNAAGVTKPAILAEFLAAARRRYAPSGVRTTADIFGLVTTVNGTLEIGQQWEAIARVTDVVLPMVYPSHYPRGSFNIPRPNADPYRVIHTAISRARERDEAIGIRGQHVRPWLQAFTLGQPKYGPEQIRAQKQAVYDAGYEGWVLWHPGTAYDIFIPGLEKTLVSRRRSPPVPVTRLPAMRAPAAPRPRTADSTPAGTKAKSDSLVTPKPPADTVKP